MTPVILQEVLKEELTQLFGSKINVYIDEPPENKERGKREDMPQIVITLGDGTETDIIATQKVYVAVGFKDDEGERGSSRLLCKNAIQKLREYFIKNPFLPKGFTVQKNLRWVMPDGEMPLPFSFGGIELNVTIPQVEYDDENL